LVLRTGLSQALWGVFIFSICSFIISFVEEASRKAWLIITWKTGKKTSVALGKKPVSFGPAKEALVPLPRYSFDQGGPPIYAVFTLEYDGRVFVRDGLAGTPEQLTDGSRVNFESASVVVRMAGGTSP
jgi:hypothetical protein